MDEAVADAARSLGSEYAAVFELLPSETKMCLRAGVGWKAGLPEEITLDAGTHSLAGYTLQSDGPLVANNLRSEARFEVPPLLAEHLVTRGITVKILGRGQPFGVLGAFAARRRSYSADEADFLQTVANVLANAIARKNAEETQRQVQRECDELRGRLQLQFERMPVPCITSNPQFRVIDCNPAAERMFGYRREEVVGQDVDQLLVPSASRGHVARISRSLASDDDTSARVVKENVTKDGRIIICEWHNIPFRDSEGNIIAVLALVQDISERRQADERLKRSELLLAEAQQIAHVGSWDWDLQSGAFEWSDEHYRIFRFKPRDPPITLDRAWNGVHPDDRVRVRQIVARSIESRQPYECRFRLLLDDGSVRNAQSRGQCALDENGMPVRMSGTIQDLSDRTEAEEKLRRSESLLAEAQHVAHLGSWSWDLRSGELVWSDECYRIFGLRPQEIPMTFESFLDLLQPEGRDRLRKIVDQVLRDRQPYESYLRVLRRDGVGRHVYVRGIVESDESARPIRLFGTVQDITERKRANEALVQAYNSLAGAHASLRESEERFRAFMDNTVAVAFMKDEQGRYVYVNKAFADQLNQTSADSLGKTDFDIWPEEIAQQYRANDLAALAADKTVERVESSLRRDGTVQQWIVLKFPIEDASGRRFLGGMAIDVTDQNRAREALRASEERVRLLLESTAEAIYGVDVDGNCTFSNPACLRLLGYRDPRDLLGKPMHELIHHTRRDGTPFHREACRIPRTFLRDEEVHTDDEVLWRANGTSFPAEYWSHPVRREGQVVGAVVTFLDITERKRLEREILETGESERRRIGQDLHDDLCQQLTGIAFTGRLLQQRLAAGSDPEAGVVEKIVQAVQQATARARDLAKGLHPVRLETDGLAAALSELTTTLESVFQISCRFRCRAGRQSVRVTDPAVAIQLYRIAQESATNAVKHGKAKKICITISVAKRRMKLAIADDGAGIAGVPHGQGMGLPVMYQRARMIGATLTISKRRQGGTLVTCSLQVRPSAPTTEGDA